MIEIVSDTASSTFKMKVNEIEVAADVTGFATSSTLCSTAVSMIASDDITVVGEMFAAFAKAAATLRFAKFAFCVAALVDMPAPMETMH